MSTKEWFINCPKGLESLLAEEILELGAESIRETVAGVYAYGVDSLPYKICLWSRLANRVLLPLAKFEVNSADELYYGVHDIPWQDHLDPANTIAVDFVGKSDSIRHTQFGAQKVKDAVVDKLVQQIGHRPDVDLRNPDIRINAHLSKGQMIISLDLSGGSLHRRGYRVAMVAAPLKENLAAALLIRAGWPQICERGGALIDPMCGSGTLLIEAAMMAADIAPGIAREKWGFQYWRSFDADLWQSIKADALTRQAAGMALELPEIRGYDKDTRAIDAFIENIAAIGLEKFVKVSAKPLAALKKPTHKKLEAGLLITNPPYGQRWGDVEELRPLYELLGEVSRHEFGGWRLAVITGNQELAGELRLRSSKKYKFFNGTIPAQLLLFELRENREVDVQPQQQRPLPENAQMLLNRLKKNARKIKSWLKRSGVSCYRLYDNDMPEYAVSIDFYGDAIYVQEHAPPATIDEQAARRRLSEIKQVLLATYPDISSRLFIKAYKRQKDERPQRSHAPLRKTANAFIIEEGEAALEVNLSDYRHTGLYLDQRSVRDHLKKHADGKHFLNLFCYTASATVQAALGGAESSLSIDMSKTYTDWGTRNLTLNDINTQAHTMLTTDCVEWLQQREGLYDLIYMDPPVYSNSNKIETVLDIQRDHGPLIRDAMAILSPTGRLVFCNSFRRFKMDSAVMDEFDVENITRQTIPVDFERNGKIHNCWQIRHRGAERP